jgi:hypothetical protein
MSVGLLVFRASERSFVRPLAFPGYGIRKKGEEESQKSMAAVFDWGFRVQRARMKEVLLHVADAAN